MSTPTPTIDTPLNNIFSFIHTSNTNVQLIIVVGIFIIIFIGFIYITKHRRK